MRIGGPLVALVVFVGIAAMGYKWILPQFTWLDAVYLSIISIFTLNNEIVGMPLSDIAKIWSIVVISIGLVLVAIEGTQIAAFIVEGRIRKIFGRRQLFKKISALSGHAIVCGFGRMGRLIAQELHDAGQKVVIVDADEKQIQSAEQAGFLYVIGDAQEDEILETAGVKLAKNIIIVLNSDAANLFVTLSARQFNPKLFIVARVQEVANQIKLSRAGADRVVCPQIIGAGRMADVVLRPAMVDFVEMAHKGVDLEMDQMEVSAGSSLLGKTLAELELPRKYGAHIVAIRQADGNTNYHPTHGLKLNVGDRLIIVGRDGTSTQIQKLQAQNA